MFLLWVFVHRGLSAILPNTGPFVSPSGRCNTRVEIASSCQAAALFHSEAFFMLAAIALVLSVSRLRQQYEMSDSFQAALRHLLLPSQGALAPPLTNQLAAASRLYANKYHRASQGDEVGLIYRILVGLIYLAVRDAVESLEHFLANYLGSAPLQLPPGGGGLISRRSRLDSLFPELGAAAEDKALIDGSF